MQRVIVGTIAEAVPPGATEPDMTTTKRPLTRLPLLRAMLCAAACLAAGPSFALYKVVGPDGKVTYTDRPPSASAGPRQRAERPRRGRGRRPCRRCRAELREAASRYPVTLYTIAGDCAPCDSGACAAAPARRALHRDARWSTAEDSDAFAATLTGGRDAPALTIGAQALRGLARGHLARLPRLGRLPARVAAAAWLCLRIAARR